MKLHFQKILKQFVCLCLLHIFERPLIQWFWNINVVSRIMLGSKKRSSGSLTPWCFWTLCDHDLNAYWDQFQAVNGSFCGIKRQVSIAWYRLIKRRNADTYTRLILFAWKTMYKPSILYSWVLVFGYVRVEYVEPAKHLSSSFGVTHFILLKWGLMFPILILSKSFEMQIAVALLVVFNSDIMIWIEAPIKLP